MPQAPDIGRVLRSVSCETLERLEWYTHQVKLWTPKINLVAPSTVPDLWSRHVLDSAQLLDIAPNHIASWVDLGSGSGAPALVVAIILKETSPETQFTLIESDKRKAAFLKLTCGKLGLNLRVLNERAEAVAPQGADILTARAFSSLTNLMTFCEIHLRPGGKALFHKGKNYKYEIEEAKRLWNFSIDVTQSTIDPESVVLSLQNVRRAEWNTV